MTVGERVSGTYCGTLALLVIGCRAPDECGGHGCWLKLRLDSRRELFESEEAVDIRDVAPLRRPTRGTLGMLSGASYAMPPRSPVSVDVRSMPIRLGGKGSLWPPGTPVGPRGPLGSPLEPADKFDALLVRPLPLGSRSARAMAPPQGVYCCGGVVVSVVVVGWRRKR